MFRASASADTLAATMDDLRIAKVDGGDLLHVDDAPLPPLCKTDRAARPLDVVNRVCEPNHHYGS